MIQRKNIPVFFHLTSVVCEEISGEIYRSFSNPFQGSCGCSEVTTVVMVYPQYTRLNSPSPPTTIVVRHSCYRLNSQADPPSSCKAFFTPLVTQGSKRGENFTFLCVQNGNFAFSSYGNSHLGICEKNTGKEAEIRTWEQKLFNGKITICTN